MAVTRPVYCTRESVKRALDIKLTSRSDQQVDEAIQSSSDTVDGEFHRVFYPQIDTRYWDWPNFQSAYPWRIWFDANELADVTQNVPVVTSGGNVIPNADIFWGHPEYSPPYTYLELNRSSSATFGQGSTPQRDVALTGAYGYWLKSSSAGSLAAAVTDTTTAYILVSSACTVALGVGDVAFLGTEWVLVTDKMMTDTGYASLSGLTTANVNDVSLGVPDGTKYSVNEILLLDSERVLVVDIAGNTLTVKRAWDGSTIAAHTNAEIYALRTLSVVRGALGSTAQTHLNAATVLRYTAPSLVSQLSRAYAIDQVLNEQGGYTRQQAEGSSKLTSIGVGIDSLRTRAMTAFARQGRSRVV